MVKKAQSLGFALNNPMNVSWTKESAKWQGIDKDNPVYDPGGGRTKLCRFLTPVDGIRAGCIILIRHQDIRGAWTVRQHIAGVEQPDGTLAFGWAPYPKDAPKDNNHTDNYIAFVEKALGVGPDDTINVHDFDFLKPLAEAIIDFENRGSGHSYTQSQIITALARAGVVDKRGHDTPTPANSRTMRGTVTQIASGATLTTVGIGAVADQVQEVAGPLAGAIGAVKGVVGMLGGWLPWLILGLGVVVVGAAIYIGWAKLSDRQKGLA